MENTNKQDKTYTISGVVFNAADYLYETCKKGKESMCMCKNNQDCKEHSEVELVCNRINDNNANRCITCGVKAGHPCGLQTN